MYKNIILLSLSALFFVACGGGGGGGPGEGEGNGGRGEKSRTTSSVKVLRLRYFYDDTNQSYNMILRAESPFEGNISFGAECDDGAIELVRISRALLDSKEISLDNNGKSFSAMIEPDTTVEYQVFFDQNEKMSLRIIQ